MTAKKEYLFLQGNGMLEELYPELSGNWEEDRKEFTVLWELNEIYTKGIDVDYEE